jgi:hypothetical protein
VVPQGQHQNGNGERANVNGTYNGSTIFSSMLEQRIKQHSAKGAPSGGDDTG